MSEPELEIPEQSLYRFARSAEGHVGSERTKYAIFFADASLGSHVSAFDTGRRIVGAYVQPMRTLWPISGLDYGLSTASFYPTFADMKSALDASVEQARRSFVGEFAERARTAEGVCEVRLTQLSPELIVSVVTDDRGLDRDLQLRAIFIDLLDTHPEAGRGELEIFAKTRGVPPRVQDAQLVS